MNRANFRKVATIEARMSSSRLPGKVLMPLAGRPSLEQLVERVRRSRFIDEVVVATTTSEKDDEIIRWAESFGVATYRGSEEDVLLRVLEAAKAYRGDVIIELTGDCPLIDPKIIDEVVEAYVDSDADYVSNILKRTYPRGLDTQVFATDLLAEVNSLTQDPADRENVSLYIYEHPERYSLKGLSAPEELYGPDIRICVDTADDYKMIKTVYENLYPKNPYFDSYDLMRFLKKNPDVSRINAEVKQKKVRP